MSNRPIHLRSLEITAFRGISNTVALNLRAPLTVIVAANGTGKTSICHAAE